MCEASMLTSRAPAMRSALEVISRAARRLKVSSKRRSGRAPSPNSHATRDASVVVLPVPAPATISSGPPPCLTASSWASFRSSSNMRSSMLHPSAHSVVLVGHVTGAPYAASMGGMPTADADDDLPGIRVRPNGPYLVRGDLPLGRTAQVETEFGEPVGWVPDEPLDHSDGRYALCRCGGSNDKPFCDGSHKTNG